MEEEKSGEEKEVLVVISKLKTYIRAQSGMNTSSGVAPVISDVVRRLCDDAVARAQAEGRKTVMERDFQLPPRA